MQPAFPEAASVKFLTNSGLYLHIPFCKKKCNYCDFYSTFVTENSLDEYTEGLITALNKWGGTFKNRPIDTIYLGGGTPSLLGHRLPSLLNAVHNAFKVTNDAEITLELNPTGNVEELLRFAKQAGINRLSIGAQSGDDEELKILGRTHTAKDTENTVKLARKMGFDNISLDIMLGLPDSNEQSLKKSLDFITNLNPEHISAYLLKIEEKTVFYKKQNELNLPDDDAQAEQYLYMCKYLEEKGYEHYEISNFAKFRNLSRHNTKYWLGEDYLGIGPSAHSCIDGKRFYYPKSIKEFLDGISPVFDGESGGKEEYIMLRLRLKSGINTDEYAEKIGENLPQNFLNLCKNFEKAKLLNIENNRIYLTDNGMLLSNSIITELLECL